MTAGPQCSVYVLHLHKIANFKVADAYRSRIASIADLDE